MFGKLPKDTANSTPTRLLLPMVTFGIAILLLAGFIGSKIAQQLRLPSVTGYICAGLLLGPTWLGYITEETIGHNLNHFTQIALMLIAFGIGEHIEINKLKKHSRSVMWIGIFEAGTAFTVVASVIYTTMVLTEFTVPGWELRNYIVLSLLLGSIGMATAPAATLLVIRELKAKGPLTSTLMAIVAIDDGLAIIIFGLVVSIAHQVLGHSDVPLLLSLGPSMVEIFGSLTLGILTGIILILVLGKLHRPGELMTAGLAILLICGEIAVFLHLSPLLAGMAAGFVLINKAERDVRVFRALNRFEPPIYVLFFTLAGTHLDIQSLKTAGLLGFAYFLATVGGKMLGVNLGGRVANSPVTVRRYLGFAMVPQAGVAIGLIFLLSSDAILGSYTQVITPVVLTGVFLSEMVGPVSARFALTRAGETHAAFSELPENGITPHTDEDEGPSCPLDDTFMIIPWKWQKLTVPSNPQGVVIFHAIDPATVRGLTRTATIFAYHFHALPMAVHIHSPAHPVPDPLFMDEYDEVHAMGYTLVTELVPGPDKAAGIVAAAEYNDTRILVLAHPVKKTEVDFKALLHKVLPQVNCPVAVVRFRGELHTERILVVLTDLDELNDMYQIIAALDKVGEHKLHLLHMMSSTAEEKDIIAKEKEIGGWLKNTRHNLKATIQALPAHSRVNMIIEAAENADLVVMGANETSSVERILFGSLVDSVAANLRKTLIVVYNAGKQIQID